MSSPTPEQLAETYIRSKKANRFGIRNPEEVLSHMAPYSLGGAGLGALVGVLREYLSSDEKATGLNRDALETILTGALLGGGAGSGLGYFTSPMKTSAEGDEAAPAQDPAPAPAQDPAPAPAQDPAPTAYDDFMPVVELIAPRGYDFTTLRPEDVDTALVPGTGGDSGQFYEQRVNEVVAGYGGLEGQTEVTPEQAAKGVAALKDFQAVLMRGEDRRGIASAIENGNYVVDRSLDHPVTVVDLGGRQVRLPYTDPGVEGYGLAPQFSANAPDANIRFSSEYAAFKSAYDYTQRNNLDLTTEQLEQFAENINFEKLYSDESTRPQALALLRDPEVGPWMQRSMQISAAYTGVTGVPGEAYRYSTPQFTASGMADRLETTSNEGLGLGSYALGGGIGAGLGAVPQFLRLPNQAQIITDTANAMGRPLSAANLGDTISQLDTAGMRNAGRVPRPLLEVLKAEQALAADPRNVDLNSRLRSAYQTQFGEGAFPTQANRFARYSDQLQSLRPSVAGMTPTELGTTPIRNFFRRPKARFAVPALGGAAGLGLTVLTGGDQDKITPEQAYSTAFDDRQGGTGSLTDQFGSIPTTRINNPLNMLQR